MQNSGNTILLTGGTSGIGLALAQRFHTAGNTVIITGRRAALLDQITADHPGMIGHPLDVADAEAVRAFSARIAADHPALNVVIHNAGIMVAEDVTGDFLDTAEATVVTNLLGPIRLTAALMPHLLEQPRATIMTVSSGLAFVPLVRTPTYSATKAAIHSWSQSLRAQLRDTGVEVLELAPPAVQTDLRPVRAGGEVPCRADQPPFINGRPAHLVGQPQRIQGRGKGQHGEAVKKKEDEAPGGRGMRHGPSHWRSCRHSVTEG